MVKTWHIETFVVAVILAGVAVCSQIFLEKGPVEWIGALAVLLTFCHVQVADRLAEAEDHRSRLADEASFLSQHYEHAKMKPEVEEVRAATARLHVHVECHWKLKYFLVSKEICWFGYFVILGAWSALVGVGVFLLYPVWRHQYRKRKPLEAPSSD